MKLVCIFVLCVHDLYKIHLPKDLTYVGGNYLSRDHSSVEFSPVLLLANLKYMICIT
jgi:hypothetical protein